VIGCYPILSNPNFKTKLTLEASSLEHLRAAVDFFQGKVPADSLVDHFPMETALEKLEHLGSHSRTKAAFAAFEQCHKQFPDGEIVISFNGGKDCTLLLHLYHLFLR